jgi:hypothetical protein
MYWSFEIFLKILNFEYQTATNYFLILSFCELESIAKKSTTVKHSCYWGHCYDRNFRRFSPICIKNRRLLKNNVMIVISAFQPSNLSKKKFGEIF